MPTRIRRITLVGGGLAGCLMAIMLAKRGYDVEVYELGTDPRLDDDTVDHSLTLLLSARGLHALAKVGLDKTALQHATAMQGTMVHTQGATPEPHN